MKRSVLFIIVFVSVLSSYAQIQSSEPCGQRELIQQLEQQYPGFKANYDKQYIKSVRGEFNVQPRRKKITDTIYYYDTIYTIPVVFHVLYNVSSENIHDSLLKNQIAALNRDFRRMNADSVNTRTAFKSRAGDARIQFELATVDPNGATTTGIVRKTTTKTSWGTAGGINNNMKFSSMSGDDAWDPKRYLNIWVCDLTYQNQDGLLGFAYPPYGHPSWTSSSWVSDPNQGVVLHYKIVGQNNPQSNTSLLNTSRMGRVAVHEVGHYFGLRHIWADDQYNFDKCADDDFIDDTPLQGIGSNFDCVKSKNSCFEAKNDLPDMIENYMDYSAHSCQNLFTKRQVQVMRTAITAYRKTLPSKIEIIERSRIFDTIIYNDILIYHQTQTKNLVIELKNDDVKENVTAEMYNLIGQQMIAPTVLTQNYTTFSSQRFSVGTYVVILRKANGDVVRKVKIAID